MNIKENLTLSLKPLPDESALGFGKYFTDHMFIMRYDEGQGWHSPEICPYGPIPLEPSAMVFHYGQAVFEGLKAYRAKDGRILLFRPEMNFARLNRSDDRMCIPPLDEEFCLNALKRLIKIDERWVPSSAGTSLYVRPFVIATEAALGVHPAKSYTFMIILGPCGSYYKNGLAPVNILIEDNYVRAVRGGIGFTKSSANYAASLKGQQKAIERGLEQVLWLDGVERKYIEEVGTMNVFFKIGGVVVTPDLSSGSILPGVTRDTVIRLLKAKNIPIEERKITAEELFEAGQNGTLEEAFGSGTAAVISPIGTFTKGGEKITVSNGNIGPLARELYNTITGIQYGELEDTFNWTEAV